MDGRNTGRQKQTHFIGGADSGADKEKSEIPFGNNSYFIASGANIPIVLIGIDYHKKCIYANKAVMPTGDIDKDMREIKLYFKDFKGKYPEKFDIGEV